MINASDNAFTIVLLRCVTLSITFLWVNGYMISRQFLPLMCNTIEKITYVSVSGKNASEHVKSA